jgi:multiple sugar transport system permease protein
VTVGSLRRNLTGFGFLLPWLIGLTLFIGYPFLAGVYYSFCDYPPLQKPVFIGLANYAEMAQDARYWQSMGVTLIYAAVAIPIGVFLALTLAMFLNARVRGQTIYRVLYYIPQLVPSVVVAILWFWIFNSDYGLLNIVLRKVWIGIDAWTSLFFWLDPMFKGAVAINWTAALLLVSPLVLVMLSGNRVPQAIRLRPGLRRFLFFAACVIAVAAIVPAVNALLQWALPFDMEKLHGPGWLQDGNNFPSEVPFAPAWALWSLVVMSMWGVGQMAVIYLAKLQDVPAELYEACEIDGANWIQKTWHVTIPMISPIILFNVVMGIIGEFQIFAEPYIMTQGGPEGKTRFAAMFVYEQVFVYQRAGYASAVAVVLFLMIVALTLLAFRISQKRVYYAGR